MNDRPSSRFASLDLDALDAVAGGTAALDRYLSRLSEADRASVAPFFEGMSDQQIEDIVTPSNDFWDAVHSPPPPPPGAPPEPEPAPEPVFAAPPAPDAPVHHEPPPPVHLGKGGW